MYCYEIPQGILGSKPAIRGNILFDRGCIESIASEDFIAKLLYLFYSVNPHPQRWIYNIF